MFRIFSRSWVGRKSLVGLVSLVLQDKSHKCNSSSYDAEFTLSEYSRISCIVHAQTLYQMAQLQYSGISLFKLVIFPEMHQRRMVITRGNVLTIACISFTSTRSIMKLQCISFPS